MKEIQAEEFESGASNRSPNDVWWYPGIASMGILSIELPRTEDNGLHQDPKPSLRQHDNRACSKLTW